MKMRLLSMLAVILLVAACTKKPTETVVTSTDGGMSGGSSSTMGTDTMGTSIAPGSKEDFTVNIGDRVFFDYDMSDLKPEGRATVERQVQWLKTYANTRITVEGHADERGTREYNLALGERRAQAVRNYMIALGLDASRVSTISYGKERPAVVGSDESSWAQNRRAVSAVE